MVNLENEFHYSPVQNKETFHDFVKKPMRPGVKVVSLFEDL